MPAKSRYPKRAKKTTRRKYAPKRTIYKSRTQRLSNQVELVRPVTMKPKSVMKKFIYYNRAQVINYTQSDTQNAQFFTMRLNSPWLFGEDVNTDIGTNTWRWNNAIVEHTNGNNVDTGTSFPGMFSHSSSPGYLYQTNCIVGGKCTLQATPLFISNSGSSAPTALFSKVSTQPNQLAETVTIDDLYALPYVDMRKVTGGASDAGPLTNNKSARIVVKYSPKRYNNIKDLRDNFQFFSHTNAITGAGTHPSEGDYLTFGVVNMMSNPTVAQKCVPIMLELKYEVTVLFTEPINGENQFPALPAANAHAGIMA